MAKCDNGGKAGPSLIPREDDGRLVCLAAVFYEISFSLNPTKVTRPGGLNFKLTKYDDFGGKAWRNATRVDKRVQV